MEASEEEAEKLNLLDLPLELISKILSYLKYSEIASCRIVCRQFDSLSQGLLNQGFYRAERLHLQIHKEIKSKLPRRESERRNSAYARHTEMLSAVETRLSLLSMTYQKHIDNRTVCFIPGKVLDELISILEIVRTTTQLPRAHEFLQELRDISSMAMEHFEERILPDIRRRERERERPYSYRSSCSSYHPESHNLSALALTSSGSPTNTLTASFGSPPFVASVVFGTTPKCVPGTFNTVSTNSAKPAAAVATLPSGLCGCSSLAQCQFGLQLKQHFALYNRLNIKLKPDSEYEPCQNESEVVATKLTAAAAHAQPELSPNGSTSDIRARYDCASGNIAELNAVRQQLDALQKQHTQFQARIASLEMHNQVLERKLKDLTGSTAPHSADTPSGSQDHSMQPMVDPVPLHNAQRPLKHDAQTSKAESTLADTRKRRAVQKSLPPMKRSCNEAHKQVVQVSNSHGTTQSPLCGMRTTRANLRKCQAKSTVS